MTKRILFSFLLICVPHFVSAQQGGATFSSPNLIYGFPGSHGKMLDRNYYIVSYDTVAKVPEWTAYRLLKSNLNGPIERTDDFRPDPELASNERSELKDYKYSGFARGHSAPRPGFCLVFERNVFHISSLKHVTAAFILEQRQVEHFGEGCEDGSDEV